MFGDELKTAIDAVKKSEEVILKYYENLPKVDIKPDRSPVTQADKEAENIIRQVIKERFPEHGFIGEEGGIENEKAEFQWIIDPIDGTSNFTRGIPLYSTELALAYKGKIVLGVSNCPMNKELLYAQKGEGAFMNDKKITVSKIDNLAESFLSCGSIYKFEKIGKLANLVDLYNTTRGHRGFGDAWSIHLLAQGKTDIVVEAKHKIWDVAAETIIVEEAGGKATDMAGNPITINTNNLVATNGLLHDQVLKMLQKQV